MFCVSLTDGIYREVLKSVTFSTEKEAEAAFAFACSLDNTLPFDVEMKSFNIDTKNRQTSMWTSLRFRKYFDNDYMRDIFNSTCIQARSKMYLQSKAVENNEKPYGTVSDWIRDNYTYEELPLKQRSEIAEAVCYYYGITI